MGCWPFAAGRLGRSSSRPSCTSHGPGRRARQWSPASRRRFRHRLASRCHPLQPLRRPWRNRCYHYYYRYQNRHHRYHHHHYRCRYFRYLHPPRCSQSSRRTETCLMRRKVKVHEGLNWSREGFGPNRSKYFSPVNESYAGPILRLGKPDTCFISLLCKVCSFGKYSVSPFFCHLLNRSVQKRRGKEKYIRIVPLRYLF